MLDAIVNDADQVWSGFIKVCDDEYLVNVNEYHGIYWVWAMEYDPVGYFVDREAAIEYARSNWDEVYECDSNNTAVENHIPVLFVRHGPVAESTRKRPLSTVGKGVKSSTPVPASADSIKILRAILDEPPGGGTFNERHRLPSGLEVTHSCSQAAGFAALHLASQYRARFGEPPIWFETCHPIHRRKLCEWALENHMPLPEETP